MPEGIEGRPVRVGFYGTGRIARNTHMPIVQRMDGVEVAALCDNSPEALEEAAGLCGATREQLYSDASKMLDETKLDVLFSCVPGFARTDADVEVDAARRGVHVFCEKPQATDVATLVRMDRGIAEAGVMSTVGFRERYRPLFNKVRDYLADKRLFHAHVTLVRHGRNQMGWHQDEDLSGGFALDWGGHAVDYTRQMTGLNLTHAHAFFGRFEGESESMTNAMGFRLSSGATMQITFATHTGPAQRGGRRDVPIFAFHYDGGRIDIFRGSGKTWVCEIDGEPFGEEDMDPWDAHDRAFLEAVRTGDSSLIVNDFHDGVFSLAPVLAAWESAKDGGKSIEIAEFIANA